MKLELLKVVCMCMQGEFKQLDEERERGHLTHIARLRGCPKLAVPFPQTPHVYSSMFP